MRKWILAIVLAAAALPAGAQRFSQVDTDQATAQAQRAKGALLPLDALLQRAQAVGRGEYLGVDFDQDRGVYTFKFMRPNGAVVAVEVDGRTGKVLRTS